MSSTSKGHNSWVEKSAMAVIFLRPSVIHYIYKKRVGKQKIPMKERGFLYIIACDFHGSENLQVKKKFIFFCLLCNLKT